MDIRNHRSGHTVFLTAAGLLTVLFGCLALVVDLGIMWSFRAKAQHSVDAAVLAGALRLTEGAAVAQQEAAESYHRNREPSSDGLSLKAMDGGTAYYRCGSEDIWVTTPHDGDDRMIKVSCNRPVDLYFARFLGINQATVSARAVADASSAQRLSEGSPPAP